MVLLLFVCCYYCFGCFLVLRKLLFVSFCVVVWVLFSVFSIFCITSLVSATPRNHHCFPYLINCYMHVYIICYVPVLHALQFFWSWTIAPIAQLDKRWSSNCNTHFSLPPPSCVRAGPPQRAGGCFLLLRKPLWVRFFVMWVFVPCLFHLLYYFMWWSLYYAVWRLHPSANYSPTPSSSQSEK